MRSDSLGNQAKPAANPLGSEGTGRRVSNPAEAGTRHAERLVRRAKLILLAGWLVAVSSLGWWMSHQITAEWIVRLAASAESQAHATARVVDRLFAEMTSVANMVANQGQVVQLAIRYRVDPPEVLELTRAQRAARLTQDPLVRKVGDFMDALSRDLNYARIYMNNLSADTVTASNWAQPDSIVGMVYTGRSYLNDALRSGKGHSFGIARINRSPSYFVSSRINGLNDEALGSVTVKFDAPDMALFLVGRHIALIVNAQGRVTTASSEPFMLRNVAALLPTGTALPPDEGEVPGEPMDIRPMTGEGQARHWLIEGKPYLLHRQPLANTQYQLLTLAALEPLAPMHERHLLTAIMVAVFGAALLFLISHGVGQMVVMREHERAAAQRTVALNAKLSAALNDAQTKERQKVELLGYIGHDLRAPLATITGYSDLLLADADENQRSVLRNIQRCVKYQCDLIDELLEYAKAELLPLSIHPAATDLPHLMEDISEYAIALCAQQNNRFRYHPSAQLPRQVSLDGRRLQQVLLNLLSNAAKFTRDGVVTLSVIAQQDGTDCTLHFAVSDTGIGIDLQKNADIFGAFQHIQSASGSTGLGLFIAQRIVTAMGGSLSVTSSLGQGTTFAFVHTVSLVPSADPGWLSVERREVTPTPSVPPSLTLDAALDESALDELASLAMHGRLTDIEQWMERHAGGVAQQAPFMALVRERLERLDFPGLHALALQARAQARG